MNVAGDKFKIEGSYKLDGNKLTIQMKIGENESNNASTIAKLTDDVLEVEGEGKKSKETVNRVEVK